MSANCLAISGRGQMAIHAFRKGLLVAARDRPYKTTFSHRRCCEARAPHSQRRASRSSTVVHASSEQPNSSRFSLEPVCAWLLFAGYLYYLLFSPFPPGEPAINPDTEALAEIAHESLNLFYLNIWLDSLKLSPIPSIAEHPMAEAIFNIIIAWGTMLLPAILADPRSEKVPQRVLQWSLIVSIWTFALMPYMAQRATVDPTPLAGAVPGSTPDWQRALGGFCVFIGVFSIGWFVFGRPEYGDWAERSAYFSTRLASQRVFGGYLVDLGIYWLAQWLLMRGAGASQTYSAVPFFGLGAWIVTGRPQEEMS